MFKINKINERKALQCFVFIKFNYLFIKYYFLIANNSYKIIKICQKLSNSHLCFLIIKNLNYLPNFFSLNSHYFLQ